MMLLYCAANFDLPAPLLLLFMERLKDDAPWRRRVVVVKRRDSLMVLECVGRRLLCVVRGVGDNVHIFLPIVEPKTYKGDNKSAKYLSEQ